MENRNHPQSPTPLYTLIAVLLLGCILMAYNVTCFQNERNARRWHSYKQTRDSLVKDTNNVRIQR